jgi:hypothetical protein
VAQPLDGVSMTPKGLSLCAKCSVRALSAELVRPTTPILRPQSVGRIVPLCGTCTTLTGRKIVVVWWSASPQTSS